MSAVVLECRQGLGVQRKTSLQMLQSMFQHTSAESLVQLSPAGQGLVSEQSAG
jgi:hypothetical protein